MKDKAIRRGAACGSRCMLAIGMAMCCLSMTALDLNKVKNGVVVQDLDQPSVSTIDVDSSGRYWAADAGIWDSVAHRVVYTFPFGRFNYVLGTSFSSGRDYLLTYANLAGLYICDTSDMSSVRLITPKGLGPCSQAEFSADGARVYALFDNSVIKVFDSASGDLVDDAFLEKKGKLASFALDAGGEAMAVGYSDGNLAVYRLGTKDIAATIKVNASSAAFSPDGKLLATLGKNDKTLRLWKTADGSLVRVVGQHAVGKANLDSLRDHVAFHPSGQYLVSSCQCDNSIRVWDLAGSKQLHRIEASASEGGLITSFAIDGYGDTLVYGTTNGAMVGVEFLTGKAVARYEDRVGALNYMASNPARPEIAVLRAWRRIVVWDLDQLRVAQSITETDRNVTRLAYSPDGRMLAELNPMGASDAQSLFSWNGKAYARSKEFQPPKFPHIGEIGFAADASSLVLLSSPGASYLDMTSSAITKTVPLPEVGRISVDRRYVVCTNPMKAGLRVYELPSGKVAFELADIDYRSSFYDFRNPPFALSPDGKSLAVCFGVESEHPIVRVYEAGSFALKKEFRVIIQNPISDSGLTSICFSHDGTYLAFGARNQDTVDLWDLTTGQMRVVRCGQVFTLDFTSDDRFLVCNRWKENSLNLVDVRTGYPVATLIDFSSGDSLVCTPDGFFAATAGAADRVSFKQGDREYSYAEWASGHYDQALVQDRIKALRQGEARR